jgi:capsular exopolysaccharide synthesis family protein
MDNNSKATEMAEPAFGQDSVNLHHYWHIILERRWLVIAAFVSILILCSVYLFKAPKIYQSTAVLQIDTESENAILNVRDAFQVDGRSQEYLQTQYQNLKGRTLVEWVISQLDLDKDDRYKASPDKVRAVLADITIAPLRMSRLVEVRAEHTSALMASKIANTLAGRFCTNNFEQRMKDSLNAYTKLNTEVNSQSNKVVEAEQAVQDYRNKMKTVSIEGSKNIIMQSLKQAQEALSSAQSQATMATELEKQVLAMLKTNSIDSIPKVVQNPYYQDLKNQLALRQAELTSLLKRYKDEYPAVKQEKERIATLQIQLNERASNIISSISNDAKIQIAQVEMLKNDVKAKNDEELKLEEVTTEFERLVRAVEMQRKSHQEVASSQKALEITMNNKSNNMRVRDEAVPISKPIKPRFMLTLFLGILGGLVVSCGLAFFINYLDDSIKSQEDIESYLRLPFLGYVSNIKSNSVVERDLQAHVHPQSNAAEGFRTIRAAISLMPGADKFRALVVTSTIPSEGKSLLASNLAIVTAQSGLKTLLVDADMRRPSVHKAFQLHSPIGLSSYLSDQISTLAEISHVTEVPNLDVICAGAIPDNPSELCGSKRMRLFVQEALKHYDRVFLDCPPVSAVSDPLVIASLSDGVVFLTKFNKIRREHARKSLQRIQDSGVRILGVVLNDIDFEGRDSYYYSYYYYQNRYYASHYKHKGKNDGNDKDKKKPEKPEKAETT